MLTLSCAACANASTAFLEHTAQLLEATLLAQPA
jgi:hypothetical protein